MNTISAVLCRVYHTGLKLTTCVVPFPRPALYQGAHALDSLASDIKQKNLHTLLVVTDQNILNLGLHEHLLYLLETRGISPVVFSNIQANTYITDIEQGVSQYHKTGCQGLICLGGGSVMDCGKLIAARIARPHKTIPQLKGLFKVLRKLPPLYAIPTTSGTGSETTIAAVVFDPANKEKYAIADTNLMPRAAVLIPELTYGLPPQITAQTGMDALTHAIEAFLGVIGTGFTNQKAMDASRLIFNNLLGAYQQGDNKQCRHNMLLAAFYAGEAFTRANVGYVHALAHSIGGYYGTAHGLANAVILPKALRWYGPAIERKLAKLAVYCQIGNNQTTPANKAIAFIEAIELLNQQLAIPTGFRELREKDIPFLAKKALKEAHPDYPVPKFMGVNDCEQLLASLLQKD